MVMEARDLQEANAVMPMKPTEVGMTTLTSAEYSKALDSMENTEVGMVMDFSDE